MKRSLFVSFAVLVVLVMCMVVYAGSTGMMDLKVGDEIYACNCGANCPCNTMSKNPGNCTCGTPLVKAKVVKIEDGVAFVKADGWDAPRPFKMQGKYSCACGEQCKCNTISQNPGKCTCGSEMKEVK
ncbi:MAG TPA: hypothetical protein VK452_01075 [Dissulfurispiraceae bacterium]|nr:hypothetical protein [Dissulfurispiraceae bacterium]